MEDSDAVRLCWLDGTLSRAVSVEVLFRGAFFRGSSLSWVAEPASFFSSRFRRCANSF